MKSKNVKMDKYYKFAVYVGLFVLINLAATTLFFRADLTRENIYSISDVSKTVVSTLNEPLTIHVFFSQNLPAPHNNTERYLRDLLSEYAIYGNRYFNYTFHDVDAKDGGMEGDTDANQQMAQNYGVYPVQIQNIEQDEVKFQKAYMGMALIHGNMVEKIPTIDGTEGLEYRITSAIQKMNNKISALLRLEDSISVKLFLSSSLEIVAPYINITGLSEVPDKVGEVVGKLNEKNYGKLVYSHHDPTTDPEADQEQGKHNLFSLQWEKQLDRLGKEIPEGRGMAGIVMSYGDNVIEVPLIQAIKVPLFGTQYKMTDMQDIEQFIDEGVESLIDINESIGYLADHGTLPLFGAQMAMPMQQQPEGISNFYNMVSQNYSVKQINLKKDPIPATLNTLVIARPTEEFSEYALYQIDQFLMQGKTLAVFLDAFREFNPRGQNQQMFSQNQGPVYLPLKTGLEKLLDTYGVGVKNAYVLDEACYKQRVDRQFGGGEQPIYFAPLLKGDQINNDLGFLKNLDMMIMYKNSPLTLAEERLQTAGVKAVTLLQSSDRAWEMSGRINLNPYFVRPPASPDGFKQLPLAFLLEGEFPSHFAGKTVPEKPAPPADDDGAGESEAAEKKPSAEQPKPDIDLSKLQGAEKIVEKGRPGKIILIGGAEILKNNIIDEEGKSSNAVFLMNSLDYLNNREDIALMRGKHQGFNLLDDTRSGTKTFIKTFNIIGLPILMVLAGMAIWFRRKSRKRKIQQMFRK